MDDRDAVVAGLLGLTGHRVGVRGDEKPRPAVDGSDRATPRRHRPGQGRDGLDQLRPRWRITGSHEISTKQACCGSRVVQGRMRSRQRQAGDSTAVHCGRSSPMFVERRLPNRPRKARENSAVPTASPRDGPPSSDAVSEGDSTKIPAYTWTMLTEVRMCSQTVSWRQRLTTNRSSRIGSRRHYGRKPGISTQGSPG
jgi:hypothetical protein